jgi:hypothetical protein
MITSLNLNTGDRDKLRYPEASSCSIDISKDVSMYNGISEIKLINLELPHVNYSVVSKRFYFGECIDQVWYNFYISIPDGNHSIDTLCDILNNSSVSNTLSGTSDVFHQNSYTFTYSDDEYGKCFIESDGAVPYTIHCRSDIVNVSSCTVNDDDSAVLNLTLSDTESEPLCKGALCTLNLGNTDYPSCDVVVQSVSDLYVEVIQSDSAIASSEWSFTSGDTISIDGATLTPYSANNNICSILGFQTTTDFDGGQGVSILTMQSPFSDLNTTFTSVTLYLTTKEPLDLELGDIVQVHDTGTFMDDTSYTVSAVQNQVTFAISVDLTQMLSYTTDAATSDGSSGTTYTLTDISYDSISNNSVTMTCTLYAASSADVTDFEAGDTFILSGMDYSEWSDFSVVVESTSLTSIDYLEVTVIMSYDNYTITSGTISEYSSEEGTDEDGSSTTLSIKTVPINRYDVTNNNRLLFLELRPNNGVSIGNVFVSDFPGRRFFARIVLPQGTDTINYLEGSSSDLATFAYPLPRLSSLYVKLWTFDGEYNLRGLDFGLCLNVTSSERD